MRKFLSNLGVFCCYSSLIYLVLLLLWGSFIPYGFLQKNMNYKLGAFGFLYSRIQEAQKTENVDLLILGSSHAYRGFDTRIFKKNGYAAFNLGSSAQTPLQTEILLKRYLDRLNPKLVVYAVSTSSFSIDGVESTLDLLANDKNDRLTFDLVKHQRHLKVLNTYVFALFYELLGFNQLDEIPIKRRKDTYVPGGYVEREMVYNKPFAFKERKAIFRDDQLEAFERVLKLLDKEGIPYVLVQTPLVSTFYNSFENWTDFEQLVKQHGPYWDFNKSLELIDTLHFYDANHLNQLGVGLFNEALIDQLEEHFDSLQ